MTKPAAVELDEQLIASTEFQKAAMASKLNWLRAGILGANDGIMSTSGLLMGVAGATTDAQTILFTGVAAVVAGSISMAGGEYTSVSAQKDSELASLETEKRELAEQPELELRELTWFYEQKGLDYDLAHKVAVQLTEKDALKLTPKPNSELNSASTRHLWRPRFHRLLPLQPAVSCLW